MILVLLRLYPRSMAIPNMSTEEKRMGYIMNPPFSKMESSFHDSTESAEKADSVRLRESPTHNTKNLIVMTRFINRKYSEEFAHENNENIDEVIA